ncbi:hypothetical protein [Methanosphaera sp.]|jgi:phage-related protein|uniref:hypothetical protein n=1 Tax=Methanosphaera sp. TaxID=2666342 RepID=UPI003D8E5ECC
MVSREVIEIVIKAMDNASKVVKDVENQMKKFNSATEKSMIKNSVATNLFKQSLENTKQSTSKLKEAVGTIGNAVTSSFNVASKALQGCVTRVKMVGQSFLNVHPQVKSLAESIKTKLETAIDNVKSKFKQLGGSGAFQNLKSKSDIISSNIIDRWRSTGTELEHAFSAGLQGKGFNNISIQGNNIATHTESRWAQVANRIGRSINSITSSGAFQNIESKMSNVTSKVKNNWNTTINSMNNKKIEPRIDLSGLTPAEKKIALLKESIDRVNNSKAAPRFEMQSLNIAGNKIKVILKDVQSIREYPITFNAMGGANELNNVINMVNKVQMRLEKVNETPLDIKVSTAGLNILNGKLTEVETKSSRIMSKARSGLSTLNQSARNASGGMGILSNAASVTAGMIGYDLLNSIVEVSRASINAQGNITNFGHRMGMNSAEIKSFSDECDRLQGSFRKVDMRAVGASALELGVKLHVPKNQMGELTKMTATMSSAFVKEGRTQEDAILAVSDAMDGQFRRLQEIGISQDMLKNNGWNGNLQDTNSLMQAMNKTLDEMGFTETAQGIYTLDDAYTALSVAGGRLIADVLIPLTPSIIRVVDALISFIDKLKVVGGYISNMPQWQQFILGLGGATVVIAGLVGAITQAGGVCAFLGSKLSGIINPLRNVYNGFKTMGDFVKNAGSNIKTAASSIKNSFNSIKTAVSNAKNGISSFFSKVKDGTALNGLKNSLSTVKQALIDFGSKCKSAMLSLKEFMVESGKNALNGLKNGLNAAKDAFIALGVKIKESALALKDFMLNTVLAKVKTLALAAAEKLAAIAQAALNLVMSLNPITLIVIAIVALIAVLGYLYFNNEKVRNTLNSLGSYLQGTFIGVWNYLCGALGNTVTFFQNLYNAIANLPGTLASIFSGIWSWITGLAGQIGSALTGMGTTIATWISGLWTNIITWLNNGLLTIGTWFSTLITTLITWGQNILTTIITWLTMLPGTIFTYLLLIITTIGQWELQLWNIAVYAGSQFVGGIITWIQTLPGRIWTWLMNTINRVTSFATIIMNKAKYAGSVMVGHFISYVSTLPGKFWTWLLSTVSRVTSFASQGASRMRTAAVNMCNSFKNKVSQLPSIMWTELMRIGDKIRNAVGELGKAMRDLAHNMLNKFKDALGIHSPGYMFKAIKGEMQYIDDQLATSQKTLGKSAEKLGQGVLNGFNKTDFTDMTAPLDNAAQTAQSAMQTSNTMVPSTPSGSAMPPTSDIQDTSTGETAPTMMPTYVNTDELANQTSMITAQTNQITATIGTNAALINTSLTGTRNTWDNLVVASNTGTQNLMSNNQNTITGYRNMTTQVGSQLNTLKSRNTSAWTNVKTVTQNNLNNILHSTKNVTTQMIGAWNTMKNSIVNAAEQIKNQSSSRFNRLWSTISTFYHRIRNPGGAGAPTRSRGHGGGGSGRAISAARNGITRILQPRKKTVQTIDLQGMFSQPEIQYMLPTKGSKTIATSDILRYLSQGGAGWSSVVSPNTRFIRNESNKWKANGPKVFGKYSTGRDLFKVREFENGTPNVSYDTFKKMAESVFSQCHYEFYWDSERYGSWQAAAQNGGMNCSDSSDFLIALAHACGLSASKVHGHWNQFGHFWANVAGHKMDTTGWMLHRTWTPSQSHAGPAPRVNIGNNDNNSNSDDITHRGRIELDVNINLTGADKLDEATVNTVIKEALTDKNILKQIARDPNFQEYDNNMKIRMNKQITRMG